jgi:DNA-binding response OmpR family regulator
MQADPGTKSILWLDNDRGMIVPYVDALTERGHRVFVAGTLSEAEDALCGTSPDIVVIDVMIPTFSEEEEQLYDPILTDVGFKSGKVFYERMRQRLDETRSRVLMLTAREDAEIMKELADVGLSDEQIATKSDLRRVSDFLKHLGLGES